MTEKWNAVVPLSICVISTSCCPSTAAMRSVRRNPFCGTPPATKIELLSIDTTTTCSVGVSFSAPPFHNGVGSVRRPRRLEYYA